MKKCIILFLALALCLQPQGIFLAEEVSDFTESTLKSEDQSFGEAELRALEEKSAAPEDAEPGKPEDKPAAPEDTEPGKPGDKPTASEDAEPGKPGDKPDAPEDAGPEEKPSEPVPEIPELPDFDFKEKPIVIVLDPGHGGMDGGANSTWSGKKYLEKNLNLTIAKYCKAELEKYIGVEVYMTRTNDTYLTLDERVKVAEGLSADLFVCLHNNSYEKHSARGACVFYPNFNYKKKIGIVGRDVASKIQSQLVSLGIKDRGILYRNSERKEVYPDKKLADYYSVIRGCKMCNIPGIIVEHAFMSNADECKQFLSSNAKLKKLGVADAKGIAEYYGLKKGAVSAKTKLLTAKRQDGAYVLLKWKKASGISGYSVYRRVVGEKKFKRLAVLPGKGTTKFLDATADPGCSYEYCVRAYYEKNKIARYAAFSNKMIVSAVSDPVVEDDMQSAQNIVDE